MSRRRRCNSNSRKKRIPLRENIKSAVIIPRIMVDVEISFFHFFRTIRGAVFRFDLLVRPFPCPPLQISMTGKGQAGSGHLLGKSPKGSENERSRRTLHHYIAKLAGTNKRMSESIKNRKKENLGT